MFDDEVREQIFAKSELQKIDLMTLSLVIKAIEEVLEDAQLPVLNIEFTSIIHFYIHNLARISITFLIGF
jgi:hypothetical protein